ncbi:MAG: hypothetical protein ACOC8K_07845 [Gemmatimonadota bacterium]
MISPVNTKTAAALALSATLLLTSADVARAQQGAVESHVRRVLTEAPDTPEGQGYLALAAADAAVAIRHAELAANDDTNLEWMQTHARHVLHALDPSLVEQVGPASGYGLQPAANQIARHIGLAADSEGASGAVETHASRVIAASNAVAARAEELADVAQQVLEAGDYSSAGGRMYDLRRLARGLQSGLDADEDGQISFEPPEGGLDHVRQHAELMAEAAGVSLD